MLPFPPKICFINFLVLNPTKYLISSSCSQDWGLWLEFVRYCFEECFCNCFNGVGAMWQNFVMMKNQNPEQCWQGPSSYSKFIMIWKIPALLTSIWNLSFPTFVTSEKWVGKTLISNATFGSYDAVRPWMTQKFAWMTSFPHKFSKVAS